MRTQIDEETFIYTFIPIEKALPSCEMGLASKPIVFMVNGKEYIGHYFINGLFYCDEWGVKEVPIATGKKLSSLTRAMRGNDIPPVTHWRYLRED